MRLAEPNPFAGLRMLQRGRARLTDADPTLVVPLEVEVVFATQALDLSAGGRLEHLAPRLVRFLEAVDPIHQQALAVVSRHILELLLDEARAHAGIEPSVH